MSNEDIIGERPEGTACLERRGPCRGLGERRRRRVHRSIGPTP